MNISFKNALNTFTNSSFKEGEEYILFITENRVSVVENREGDRGFYFGEYVSDYREIRKYLVKYENDRFSFLEKTESTESFEHMYGDLNVAIFNIMKGYISKKSRDPEVLNVHFLPLAFCEENIAKKTKGLSSNEAFEQKFKDMKKELMNRIASKEILKQSKELSKAEIKVNLKNELMDIKYERPLKNELSKHIDWFSSSIRIPIVMLMDKWYEGKKTDEEKYKVLEMGVDDILEEFKEKAKFQEIVGDIDLLSVGFTVFLKPEEDLLMRNRERLNAQLFGYDLKENIIKTEDKIETKLKV